MDEPADFDPNPNWEREIKYLSDKKLRSRYLDEGNYSDVYRYLCYLELKNRLSIIAQEGTVSQSSMQHKWRCDHCGNMRTQVPCEHCGAE